MYIWYHVFISTHIYLSIYIYIYIYIYLFVNIYIYTEDPCKVVTTLHLCLPKTKNHWCISVLLEFEPFCYRLPTKPELQIIWRAFNSKAKAISVCFGWELILLLLLKINMIVWSSFNSSLSRTIPSSQAGHLLSICRGWPCVTLWTSRRTSTWTHWSPRVGFSGLPSEGGGCRLT